MPSEPVPLNRAATALIAAIAALILALAGYGLIPRLLADSAPTPIVLPVAAPVSAPAYYPGPEVTTPVVAPDAPVGAPVEVL